MKKYLVILSIFVAIGVVTYKEKTNIAIWYATLFVVDDATKGADAILILSGNIDTRAQKAIELYKKKYAMQIWVTTPLETKTMYPHILKPQNVLLAEILTYEGVDKLYILPSLKGGATSTFDEAYDLASYLKDNELDRIILVTDGFHTLRAQQAFKKVFKKFNIQTKLQFAPSFSRDFQLDEWLKYESSIYRLLVQEPLGLLFYYFNDSNSEVYINT